ncbi:MAG: DUF3373 family protein [Sulfuricurvum sp.]|uniref:DUF3373 family protein n=1 Tax=Sulfuricurvum sp. TaxID=2025608 RepID=UPI00262F66BA|nr:DUF3373 family protein [Sulfuricurvum sp.]MDD5159116.1 DUF3373 family protein [Sulfuricurvum sp.]
MKKISLSIVVATVVSGSLFADEAAMQAQINMLMQKIEKLEKAQGIVQENQTELKETQVTQGDILSKVNSQSANDNIKWDIDFRSAYHNIGYQYADNAKTRTGVSDSLAGKNFSNPSLLTNRLWLGMGSKVNDNLFFNGQLAAYYNWGADTNVAEDKIWQESSRPNDVTVRLRQAYLVYKFGQDSDVPINASVGRRAATDGFLANHREGTQDTGSPLAHITNMEIDGAMMQFNLDKVFLPGSYLKVVYGRAHDPVNRDTPTPYIDVNTSDADNQVDFIILPMSIYDNGQNKLMAQYSMIMNSKGERISDNAIKTASGTTHLAALSYQLDGLNEDIDFLDNSTVFASIAMTSTNPNNGYRMLGSTENQTGYSFWAGFLFPDMMTNGGRFGVEYNYGSKYWSPMTWAEDTAIGSKIATRGNAYEGYWNIPIVGKNLSAQLRYTYLDHHYRANTTCYWDNPLYPNLDHSQELRAFVRYQY